MELPLFPLATVLCPGVVLPLHVFEERYRIMIGRCLQAGSAFGVVLIQHGSEVGDGPLVLAEVGTLAVIREAARYPDGRLDLLVVGTARFRISAVDASRHPYLVGDVTLLDEPLGDPARARRMARTVGGRAVAYLGRLGKSVPARARARRAGPAVESRRAAPVESREEAPTRPFATLDPTALSHLVSGLLKLDHARRQALLEAPTTETRLDMLAALMAREIAFLDRGLRLLIVEPSLPRARRN